MKFTAACVQMGSLLGKKQDNLCTMTEYVKEIKAQRPETKLVVFPECANSGYECPELYNEMAEEYPSGESIESMRKAARENELYIAFGFVEKEGNVLYNSAVLIDDKGELLGRYRKAHLVAGMEEESFSKGSEFPVFDTPMGKIGIMICWDSVFPEAARLLTLHGAEIILVPEAVERGIEAEWELALRARAFDNGVYLLSCNHVGTDRELTYFGQSSVISPYGEVLAKFDDKEGILYHEIDMDAVFECRDYFYMLRQRRPGIYTDLCTEQ